MTREEAIESLKTSLARGDETMNSTTWSGGSFKSDAVRLLLAEHNKFETALLLIGENYPDPAGIAQAAVTPST